MKSTTCPTAKPGSRKSRSPRLPSVPPSSAPSATAQPREPSLREMRTITMVTTTAAMVNTQVEPSASENAAPELKTRLRPRKSPSSGWNTPVSRVLTTSCLVIWSITSTTTVSTPTSAISPRRGRSSWPRWPIGALLGGHDDGGPPGTPGARRRSVSAPDASRAAQVGVLARGVLGGDAAAALDVTEQTLEVALQAGAVVTLEHPQLVDLALQQRPFALQLVERAVALLVSLAGEPLALDTCFGDQSVGLGLAVVDVLVVQALGPLQHAGGRLGLAGIGGGGGGLRGRGGSRGLRRSLGRGGGGLVSRPGGR